MNPYAIPAFLKDFALRLSNAGYGCFLVGGATRNMAMGRKPEDFDIATDATPAQVMKLFRRVVPTGIEHGTVTVLLQEGQIEVTTFRTESGYSDGRHPDSVGFSDSIYEDLKRRDFTMNAIALDLASGKLIDPHDGLADIKRKMIRAIGDPVERFTEDGLRPLRAIRFAGKLGFAIDEATLAAIPKVLDRVALVAMERIRDEITKLLSADEPSTGFLLMERSGLLGLILPELERCRGVEQKGFHRFDVLDHSLYACDGAPKESLAIRLAALFHDIGKPATKSADETGVATFYGHEAVSAKMAEGILDRLRYPIAMRKRVVTLIREHMFHYEEEWSDAAVRRFIARVGEEFMDDLFLLRMADQFGMSRSAVHPENLIALRDRIGAIRAQEHAFTLKDLAIDGSDLKGLGIPPGRALGMILNELLETVLDDPGMNERQALLACAEKLKGKYLPQPSS
jgi:tRNA nucleotidyltransferase (CCA-adding enzyme)